MTCQGWSNVHWSIRATSCGEKEEVGLFIWRNDMCIKAETSGMNYLFGKVREIDEKVLRVYQKITGKCCHQDKTLTINQRILNWATKSVFKENSNVLKGI